MAKPSTPGTLKVRRPRKPHLPPTLLDITLNGVAPVVGQSTNWSVSARYSNNTFVDVTASSVLSTNNAAVATWTAQGTLSALSTGSVIITAVYQGQTTSQSLVIQSAPPPNPPPAPVTLLSLTLTALGSVPSVGGLQNYSVSGHFSDNTDQDLTSLVSYASSNHNVAVWVTTGTLQAVAGGTSILTVSYQGVTSSPTTINIATPPPPPPPVVLSQLRLNPPAAPNPAIGGTVKYTVTGIMSDGSLQDWTLLVTYHTGNAAIATWISPLGTLSGVAAGTCNIYVDTQVTINNVVTTITSPILTVTVPTNPTPPPPTVGGRTFYCALYGNDSVTAQQAQNPSTPKKTPSNAVQLCAPNDQLICRGGTYNDSFINIIPSGTSWSNKVLITNYPGEPVWIKPLPPKQYWVISLTQSQQYIEFNGINLDQSGLTAIDHIARMFDSSAGSATPMSHHIRITNAEIIGPSNYSGYNTGIIGGNDCEFTHLKIHGKMIYSFYCTGSRNLFENNNVYSVATAGVHIYFSYGTPANNIIRNNFIHDLTESVFGGVVDPRMWGILISGTGHQVYNNVIYNINYPYQANNAGIFIYLGSGHKVWNNTLNNNTTEGITNGSAGSGIEIRNNIAYLQAHTAFTYGTATQSNNMSANPLFVNPAVFDFRLQAGSAARNAGITIPQVTTDIAGTPRPKGAAYDIGAYEYIE